jgi:thiol-disulfide isomerase/thioredoxin
MSGSTPAPAAARRRRALLFGVGAAAALAGIGGGIWQSRRQAAEAPAPPTLWSLRFARPDGGELAVADFRGRPLLINFWATWCPPCLRELPAIDRFAGDFRASVQVIGLAVDREQPVREFLARQPVTFPVGLAALDGTELSRTLGNGAGGLPFTALLDTGGAIVQQKAGETTYDELAAWARRL